MKILVVDDSLSHRQAAEEQLGDDHHLIVLDNYGEAMNLLKPGTDIKVVLSDLLMPAESHALGPEGMNYFGHQIGAGWGVLFRAAGAGVKNIAVITDANHHNHPVSALLDFITSAYWRDGDKGFTVNQSSVMVTHAPLLKDGRKDWSKALATLLAA